VLPGVTLLVIRCRAGQVSSQFAPLDDVRLQVTRGNFCGRQNAHAEHQKRAAYTIGYHHSKPMHKILIILLLFTSALPLLAQGSPPQAAADQPYAMEFYYKTQWGHQQEFLQLFLKNHYPLLQKLKESGRILSVKIESPANHLPEDARWDYRVTIRFKNSALATTANPAGESLIKQLWPDQETYKREEQKRFEILLAHWDVPVTDITPR
jgi:hypothetical protein